LWFGGEILGAIIGVAVASEGGDMVCVYGCALIGAVGGALIAFLIANSASTVIPPVGWTPTQPAASWSMPSSAPVEPPQVEARPAGEYCPACGQKAAASDQFCRSCGADLGEET
jgi:hypothetical protein